MSSYRLMLEQVLCQMEVYATPTIPNGMVYEFCIDGVRYRLSRHTTHNGVLSPRQYEILQRIAHGDSNRAIVFTLGSKMGTIDEHVGRMFEKLEVNSRPALIAKAYEHGLLPILEPYFDFPLR
jgi:DNA-binding NarL/FixJ family response regulator